MNKTLFVILGPTAVGKTRLSIEVAQRLQTEILSCDSRQFYRGIPIATAAPTAEELAAAPHHFIQFLDLEEYYSCGRFEVDALQRLREIFDRSDTAVMCGGSMLYADALCRGIDDRPDVDQAMRDAIWSRYESEGIDGIWGELKLLDPIYCSTADPRNSKRIIHAYETCIASGKPYSEIMTRTAKLRDFRIVKIGLRAEREVVYDRINRRVDAMIEAGLEQEARSVYDKRHLNSLNTVGLKEMFRYIEGEWTLEQAADEIRKNTRRYAKKQLTWWQRDDEIRWFESHDEALAYAKREAGM